MTKKDYELIAGVFKNIFDKGFKTAEQVELFWELEAQMEHELSMQNKKFDYRKFIDYIDPVKP